MQSNHQTQISCARLKRPSVCPFNKTYASPCVVPFGSDTDPFVLMCPCRVFPEGEILLNAVVNGLLCDEYVNSAHHDRFNEET